MHSTFEVGGDDVGVLSVEKRSSKSEETIVATTGIADDAEEELAGSTKLARGVFNNFSVLEIKQPLSDGWSIVYLVLVVLLSILTFSMMMYNSLVTQCQYTSALMPFAETGNMVSLMDRATNNYCQSMAYLPPGYENTQFINPYTLGVWIDCELRSETGYDSSVAVGNTTYISATSEVTSTYFTCPDAVAETVTVADVSKPSSEWIPELDDDYFVNYYVNTTII